MKPKSKGQTGVAHACARDQMGDGYSYMLKGDTLRSRARACVDFYGPAIARDTDAAVDYALASTQGSADYRRALCFYCLHLGVNTFLDQLESVLACHRQGELSQPARAFHARLRKMATQRCGRIRAGGAA